MVLSRPPPETVSGVSALDPRGCRICVPQLVVFGLQFENVQRNTNLVRAIYNPRTGLSFAKPRFVLDDKRLRMVNHPCVSPQELPDILRNFEQWQWSEDEAQLCLKIIKSLLKVSSRRGLNSSSC